MLSLLVAKKPLTKKEFQEIYSKVPRLTVELIVKTSRGIILTKRSIPPYIGNWHIPGGTVCYKERLEDAVARVAKEELGIEVEIKKFVDFIYYPNLIRDFGWGWPVGAAFLVNIKKGKPKGSEQGEEIGYFNKLPQKIVPSQGDFLLEQDLVE